LSNAIKQDPADVMKAGVTELTSLGWKKTSVIGNEFNHKALSKAEVRLLYSGGVIHVQGWHREGTVEVRFADYADNEDKMIDLIQAMHDLLWEANQ
jgi:hypothetical protein